MKNILSWISRRLDQEGTLILFVVGGLLAWFIFFRPVTKQTNNSDFKGSTIRTVNVGTYKKALIPFIEAFGGVNTSNDNKAEAGARVGVRWEF